MYLGGWMDVPKKEQRVRITAENPETFLVAEVFDNRAFEFVFRQKQDWCHALGSGSCRLMQQSMAIDHFVAVLICRFSHAVRRACALHTFCVSSAHLRGLCWEIEHDQHAQENLGKNGAQDSCRAHLRTLLLGQSTCTETLQMGLPWELLSLRGTSWVQALLLVKELAQPKPG